jgi:hypothetical protein
MKLSISFLLLYLQSRIVTSLPTPSPEDQNQCNQKRFSLSRRNPQSATTAGLAASAALGITGICVNFLSRHLDRKLEESKFGISKDLEDQKIELEQNKHALELEKFALERQKHEETLSVAKDKFEAEKSNAEANLKLAQMKHELEAANAEGGPKEPSDISSSGTSATLGAKEANSPPDNVQETEMVPAPTGATASGSKEPNLDEDSTENSCLLTPSAPNSTPAKRPLRRRGSGGGCKVRLSLSHSSMLNHFFKGSTKSDRTSQTPKASPKAKSVTNNKASIVTPKSTKIADSLNLKSQKGSAKTTGGFKSKAKVSSKDAKGSSAARKPEHAVKISNESSKGFNKVTKSSTKTVSKAQANVKIFSKGAKVPSAPKKAKISNKPAAVSSKSSSKQAKSSLNNASGAKMAPKGSLKAHRSSSKSKTPEKPSKVLASTSKGSPKMSKGSTRSATEDSRTKSGGKYPSVSRKSPKSASVTASPGKTSKTTGATNASKSRAVSPKVNIDKGQELLKTTQKLIQNKLPFVAPPKRLPGPKL